MLEMLISTNTKKTCPIFDYDTGPGNKQLTDCVLDDNKGYFGEVPPSELITGSGLASLVGLTTGSNQTNINNISWLKFVIDGKILLVAKQNIKHSISWDELNQLGLIFGNNKLTIGKYNYKLRVLSGVGPDYADYTLSGTNQINDHSITFGSEWNRLIYNSHELIPNSQVGSNWTNFTNAELNLATGYGRLSWCKETVNNVQGNTKYGRGHSNLANLYCSTNSAKGTSYGWRPVLELVSANGAILPNSYNKVNQVEYLSTLTNSPITYSDFRTAVGLNTTTTATATGKPLSNSNKWINANINGKNCYVSLDLINNYVTWTGINNLGIYNGSKIITISGKQYRIRSLSGLDYNVDNINGDGFYQIGTRNSEHTLLFTQIVNNYNTTGGAPAPNRLAPYKESDIQGLNGFYEQWGPELTPDGLNAIYLGYSGTTFSATRAKDRANSFDGYRAVLEQV